MSPATMTPAEFAERIGMKESWVRLHIKEIPHRRMGRFLRFTDADVEKFLESTAESDSIVQRTSRSTTAVGRRRP
ncbi:helix-turn-helix domain-containing protein [Demequina sp. SO4-18]|uniref:helix-turn-helix domain-containing protein n=1 Tax=Demequina sp. SO4-18 TaxID=3401026 RepID=UPI003B5BE7B9